MAGPSRICAALVALALALAGCSLFEPAPLAQRAPAPAPPSRAPSLADEMVAYLGQLRSLDEAGLAAEASRQRDLARAQPSELATLRIALALSAAPQSDDAEILALVEPLAGNGQAGAEVRGMASFLHAMASERRRLRESSAAAGARSRDDRRAYEAQKQRADALQERAATLQQKLDALTNLEKSLSSRQAPKR